MFGYRRLPFLLLLPLMLGAAADRRVIVVTRSADLSFGTLRRGESVTISYGDSRAGEYIIQGEPSAPFRLSLAVSTIRSERDDIELLLENRNCAYSSDNGISWTAFTGDGLIQDLRFPDGATTIAVSTVRVRIGGRFTAGARQRRGEYRGNLMVTAEYLVEGDAAGKTVR